MYNFVIKVIGKFVYISSLSNGIEIHITIDRLTTASDQYATFYCKSHLLIIDASNKVDSLTNVVSNINIS